MWHFEFLYLFPNFVICVCGTHRPKEDIPSVTSFTSIRASKRRGAAARTSATQDLQVVENPHLDLHLGLHPK